MRSEEDQRLIDDLNAHIAQLQRVLRLQVRANMDLRRFHARVCEERDKLREKLAELSEVVDAAFPPDQS